MSGTRIGVFRVVVAALAAILFASPAHATCPDTACYEYDALGRLIGVEYGDGRTIAYSYDAAGNRTEVERTGITNTAPIANDDTLAVTIDTAKTFDPRANDSDASRRGGSRP